MGNRAVITFDKNPIPNSLGVYLHSNGGAESVYPFLEALDYYKVRDNSDPSYELARFVQIVANFFGGTTSIGVNVLAKLDCTNGDNGLYVVHREGGTLSVSRSKGGLTAADFWPPAEVEAERKRAMKHRYNVDQGDGETMAAGIRKANDPHFKKEGRF